MFDQSTPTGSYVFLEQSGIDVFGTVSVRSSVSLAFNVVTDEKGKHYLCIQSESYNSRHQLNPVGGHSSKHFVTVNVKGPSFAFAGTVQMVLDKKMENALALSLHENGVLASIVPALPTKRVAA